MPAEIVITNARLHNLQHITLRLPKNSLIVFTGLSGSGKSTLALDTLLREGQRQYMESLGLVGYNLGRPAVDSIVGLAPAISIDQHLTNRSPRSTVGTATDIYTYLRVLFARQGSRPCPHCGGLIPASARGEESWAADEGPDEAAEAGPDYGESGPCPHCGRPVPEIGMAHFSFNKPAGACPACTGLGVVLLPDLDRLVDPARTIRGGAVAGWNALHIAYHSKNLEAAGRHYGFHFDLDRPAGELGPAQRDLLLYGAASPQFQRHFPGVKPPTAVSRGNFEGVVTNLQRRYAGHAGDDAYRQRVAHLLVPQACPDCQGTRLNPASRAVTVAGRTIVEAARLPLDELAAWLDGLPAQMAPTERAVGEPLLDDLRGRVRRVVDVGLGYLTLERSSPTLAAGEAQRLRLAALLGAGLTGVLYVLDEPTIGLHPRDTGRLIQTLRRLRDLGNTVLVIEHDLEVMRAADYLVDLGPGGGRDGGRVVAAGTPAEVAAAPASITGAYLAGRRRAAIPPQRRAPGGAWLTVHGARAHNLKGITARLPLGLLVAVTGVSGAGKSSLLLDILDRAARQRFYHAGDPPGPHEDITGWEYLDGVATVDQSPLGRTTRSNAITYIEAWSPLREALAATPEARAAGLKAGHFSFNVPGGRCERCAGTGTLAVQMHFMPDVLVRCPACRGRRFRREVLAIRYRGLDVAEILDLSAAEALEALAELPAAAGRLQLLVDVGLGYLRLGQPASTFSGGEAQRVKLARELSRRPAGRTLYLLDEPTTGLHPADTARLVAVLHRLVDAGNTVVVIEHNLDVAAAADWVLDLGPQGGAAGGEIVVAGPPEQVARAAGSATAAYLRRVLGSV